MENNSPQKGYLRSSLEAMSSQARQMGRALRLVWRSAPKWTAVQLVLVIFQGVLPLVILYVTRRIVDAVSESLLRPSPQSQNVVMVWVGLAFGAAVLSVGLRSLSVFASQAQSLQVTDAVSDLLHAQSIAVDLQYYEDPGYYDTLHRAQQEAPFRPTRIINGFVQVAQSGIALLGIAGLLFSFDKILGLVLFLVCLPGIVVRMIHARKFYQFDKEQSQNERKAWYYHWMLVDSGYAKEIRLFQLGHLFMDRFRDIRNKIRAGKLELTGRRSVADFMVQVLASSAVYGTFAFAALRTIRGEISLGEMVVIFIGFQNGLSYLQSVLNGLAGLYEDNLFLANFYRFLDLQPTARPVSQTYPVPPKIKEGVRFHNVSFSYHAGGTKVLQEINLTLGAGEVIALVGANGSGKTTLIKLLCQLYKPTDGKITVDGINLGDLDPVQWRQKLSVILQDYAHYFLKAWENIWIGDITREQDIDQIAATAAITGADSDIRQLPNRFDTVLGNWFDKGQELSSGQWQKIALARVFWRDAEIVILDEPTSSLDAQVEAELFANLRQQLHGKSAILISHRFSTIQMADRIFVFDEGRIIESGSHDELMRLDGRYANLYKIQAEAYQPQSHGQF